jgi:ergothioneine biosynthesis protein EgtB
MSATHILDHHRYGPYPDQSILVQWLLESNTISCHIIENLKPGKEIIPCLDIVNPPYWEFGHITWFHEFWVHRKGLAASSSALADADQVFDSSTVAHSRRWTHDMPSIQTLLKFNQQVVDQTVELLQHTVSPDVLYFINLALFHQDMHNEAFAYTWQTIGYPAPFESFKPTRSFEENFVAVKESSSWIHFEASVINMGAQPNSGFIFDNEKWLHPVEIPAFSISNDAVTNAEYIEFIEAHQLDGKDCPSLFPLNWKRMGKQFLQRRFNQWHPLQMNHAVEHVSFKLANDYCQWRGVRLPTEYELQLLMSQDAKRWTPSELWEWSSSTFKPFPGFSPDPYADYSAPWFDGRHQVLKGWSRYTPERLRRPGFRNFYKSDRADHFCGFRTCLI